MVEVDREDLEEFIEQLEMLLDDMVSKPKEKTLEVIKNLKNSSDVESLIKIQDELESISNMSNIDSFTRNEMMNVIADLETLINN